MADQTVPMPTDTRTPAGRLWLDLAVRFHNAAVEQDRQRMNKLEKLLDGIESEYPTEVAAEKARWGWTDA